jgi:hypothetical protein
MAKDSTLGGLEPLGSTAVVLPCRVTKRLFIAAREQRCALATSHHGRAPVVMIN